MSCTAEEVVAAEKFRTNCEWVSGKSRNKLCANTVFPVPVAPTSNTLRLIFRSASTTKEFLTLSTVGTEREEKYKYSKFKESIVNTQRTMHVPIISWKVIDFTARQVGTFASHPIKSFFEISTK